MGFRKRLIGFDPSQLLMIDAIARCYGKLPHEIMDLDPYQMGIALLCYQTGTANRASVAARSDGAIFPVVVMGSL